jgi:hypothetical protein
LLTTRRLEVPESKRDRRQIKPSQAGQTSPRKEHTLVIDEVSDEEDPPLPPLSSSFEVSLITRTFAGRRSSVLAVLPCFDAILPASANELV